LSCGAKRKKRRKRGPKKAKKKGEESLLGFQLLYEQQA